MKRISLTLEKNFVNKQNVSFSKNLLKWNVSNNITFKMKRFEQYYFVLSQEEIILIFESKRILFRKESSYFFWRMRRSKRDNIEIWIKKNSFLKRIFWMYEWKFIVSIWHQSKTDSCKLWTVLYTWKIWVPQNKNRVESLEIRRRLEREII